MMQNNNLSVLPFYDKIERQHHRKSYAYGDKRPLIFPQGRILPFQFQTGFENPTIESVKAFDIDGNLIEDITQKMLDAGMYTNGCNVVFSSEKDVGIWRYKLVALTVEINGIHWATRNVDLPGTLASAPESLGSFYQWGSNVAWSSRDPLQRWNPVTGQWDGALWASVARNEWLPENNPSPEGFRIPTREELENLLEIANSWTFRNGVAGRLFGTAPNQLFLPAVGNRENGTLFEPNARGNYWSGSLSAFFASASTWLRFSSQLNTVQDSIRNMGYSIRCVSDEPQYFVQPTSQHTGCAYLEIELSNEKTFYSDIFRFAPQHKIDKMLKIEWWDNDNLVFDAGEIDFTPPFKNEVYLQTQLGKPEYPFEEKGEDRDGYFFPEKQISKKTFKFSAHGIPEYLVDAMRIIRLSDNIRITSFGIEYTPDTFLIEPIWTERGDVATCNCEFETNTVIKKTGGWLR